MADKTVVVGSTVSASQLKDLFRQIDDGSINGQIMQAVLEHRNPWEVLTDLDDFFRIRPGLYVSEGFRNLVVAKVSGVDMTVDTKSFDFPRDTDMSDSEIETKLGDGHIWEEGVLMATLKQMLTEQEGGKDGKLLNNSFANLFYTSSCVVSVYWRSGGREWDVSARWRDDCRWSAGLRAFSLAT